MPLLLEAIVQDFRHRSAIRDGGKRNCSNTQQAARIAAAAAAVTKTLPKSLDLRAISLSFTSFLPLKGRLRFYPRFFSFLSVIAGHYLYIEILLS